jgi:hypothetical protein
MIINLLALLVILAIGAVAGVLFTVRHYERCQAELQAEEYRLAARDLHAAWPTIRNDSPGRNEPSAFDSRDRLPI